MSIGENLLDRIESMDRIGVGRMYGRMGRMGRMYGRMYGSMIELLIG